MDEHAKRSYGRFDYLFTDLFYGNHSADDLQHGIGNPACSGRFQIATVFSDCIQRGQHYSGPCFCYQSTNGCCRGGLGNFDCTGDLCLPCFDSSFDEQGKLSVGFERDSFHKDVLLETIRIGLPGGIQNAVISFSNIIVQYNINSFGAAAVAGCSAYTKIDGFAILPVMSFSMAITTFTGQNVGAKNYERVKKRCQHLPENVLCSYHSDFSCTVFVWRKSVKGLFVGYTGAALCDTDDAFSGSGIFVPCNCTHLLRCCQRCGYLNGSDACSDRKYVCSAHDLDYACYAVCTQHHHRFLGYSLTWLTSALTMLIYYHKSGWLEKYQLAHS